MVHLQILIEHGLSSEKEDGRGVGHILTYKYGASDKFDDDKAGLDDEDTKLGREEELRSPEKEETSDGEDSEYNECN